ncbi:hypothetical protein ACFXPJ_39150, partial [Streptomyces goshikiensis]
PVRRQRPDDPRPAPRLHGPGGARGRGGGGRRRPPPRGPPGSGRRRPHPAPARGGPGPAGGGPRGGAPIARINLAVALTRSGAAERDGSRERDGAHDRDGAAEQDGARERARDLLVRALALAERAGHTETMTLAHQHLAHHLLADGSPAEAAAHAARGLALAPRLAAPRRVALRTLYGRALAATGRTGEAVRQLGDALREARAHAYEEGEKAARSGLAALGVLTDR